MDSPATALGPDAFREQLAELLRGLGDAVTAAGAVGGYIVRNVVEALDVADD